MAEPAAVVGEACYVALFDHQQSSSFHTSSNPRTSTFYTSSAYTRTCRPRTPFSVGYR